MSSCPTPGPGLQRALGLLLTLLAMTAPECAAQPSAPLSVSYDAHLDRLSVRALRHSFVDVLAAIGDAAAIAVVVHNPDAFREPVTIAIVNRPLEDALAALLAGKSYALERSGSDRRLTKLLVLSALDAPASAARRAAPAGQAQTPPTVPPARDAPSGTLPDLTQTQRANILEALRRQQAHSGEDPRDELEALRRLIAPDAPSFRNMPDDALPEAILELMRRSSPAAAD